MISILFFLASYAFSSPPTFQCYEIDDRTPVTIVGQVALAAPADQVCVFKTNGVTGVYYRVQFLNGNADIGQFASRVEEINVRQNSLCRNYILEFGRVAEKNVNPDSAYISIQTHFNSGHLRIYHPSTGEQSHILRVR
jgi:hypothetical protein